MQVLCKKTTGNAECQCCVCGQGFVIFWERESHSERIEGRHELQEMLRRQHRTHRGPEAHPEGFMVPAWKSSYSGSELCGTAQAWDL